MQTLYDSDNPDSIPDGVWAAGYCDGYAARAWNARGWARFPNALKIAVFASTNDGKVGDVERGDMLPWELPNWVLMRRAAGEDPWGYVNMSNWGPTRTEFQLRGIPEPHWWVALYDGVPTIPPGAIAKQYANQAIIPGNPHYDLSVVSSAYGGGQGTIGDEDLTPQQEAWIAESHAALGRLEVAFGTATPAGPAPGGGPNYLGFLNNELRTGLTQIADIHKAITAGPGGAALTPAQAQQLAHIEAMLTTGLKGT